MSLQKCTYSVLAPFPKRIVLETTTACNLQCVYCPTGQGLIHRPKFMSRATLDRALEQIAPFAKHVYIEFLGEPLADPHLFSIIEKVSEFANVIDLATNGTLIKPWHVEHMVKCHTLSVTISALDECYEKVHGSPLYSEAMRGLSLLAATGHPRLSWTWVTTNISEHQIPEARRRAKEMGVHLGVKGVGLGLGSRHLAARCPKLSRYSGPRLKKDRLTCREFWRVGYICSDGAVVGCGFDWPAMVPAGNINETPFAEIWNGPIYQEWRRNRLDGKVVHPACRFLCGW